MSEEFKKYDLIIQNNASKETFLYSGQTDTSTSHLYHKFEDLEIDAPEGEYTYYVLHNTRDDVVYDFAVPLGDTIVHADDKEVLLKDLQPSTGLLRIGDSVKNANTYDNNDKNTIFYYDN